MLRFATAVLLGLATASAAAQMTPAGVLAYRYRGHLDDAPDGLRLGLKGTAKIFGPPRPFLLWVLRRPLALVREWMPF